MKDKKIKKTYKLISLMTIGAAATIVPTVLMGTSCGSTSIVKSITTIEQRNAWLKEAVAKYEGNDEITNKATWIDFANKNVKPVHFLKNAVKATITDEVMEKSDSIELSYNNEGFLWKLILKPLGEEKAYSTSFSFTFSQVDKFNFGKFEGVLKDSKTPTEDVKFNGTYATASYAMDGDTGEYMVGLTYDSITETKPEFPFNATTDFPNVKFTSFTA